MYFPLITYHKKFNDPMAFIESILKENSNIFLTWALGKGYENKSLSETPKLWNDLHSDLFILEENRDQIVDLKRMIKAWIDEEF